jgi:SAM-dependent methyltransferase
MPEFRVTIEDKLRALHYYESISQHYNRTVGAGLFQFLRWRERKAVLDFAKIDQMSGRMLDVGCGTGFYALKAAQSGMRVTAIDASKSMIKPLQGRVDRAIVADIERYPIEEEFDLVICAGVLDFVLYPDRTFRNLCRLVGPGGNLIILAAREGVFGNLYRAEKQMVGISVNLFPLSWFKHRARQEGLAFVGASYPLPTNLVAAFRRE